MDYSQKPQLIKVRTADLNRIQSPQKDNEQAAQGNKDIIHQKTHQQLSNPRKETQHNFEHKNQTFAAVPYNNYDSNSIIQISARQQVPTISNNESVLNEDVQPIDVRQLDFSAISFNDYRFTERDSEESPENMQHLSSQYNSVENPLVRDKGALQNNLPLPLTTIEFVEIRNAVSPNSRRQKNQASFRLLLPGDHTDGINHHASYMSRHSPQNAKQYNVKGGKQKTNKFNEEVEMSVSDSEGPHFRKPSDVSYEKKSQISRIIENHQQFPHVVQESQFGLLTHKSGYNQSKASPHAQGAALTSQNNSFINNAKINNVGPINNNPSDMDVSLGSRNAFARNYNLQLNLPLVQGDNQALKALEGEIGLNDNPCVTGGSFISHNSEQHNFGGYETPKSSRHKNTINDDLANRQEIQGSMNEIIIENQNVDGLDTISDFKKIDNPQNNPPHHQVHLICKYDRKSIYIFRQETCFRQWVIRMVDSKIFEYVMVVVILLNSVALSLYDYNDRESSTKYNQVLDLSNLGFTFIFILEAMLKIIAKGFIFHPESYLKNGWNMIDSVVVLSGIIEVIFGSVKLKALRVIRVFRPLKTINVIPSMKNLIQALIDSLPDFVNVGIFLIYVFILFATMGVHQYNGQSYNTCRYTEKPLNGSTSWPYDSSISRACSISGNGNYICPEGMFCGNQEEFSGQLDIETEHLDQRAYINYGITNFDHLGTSLLSVFQIINSDTWYGQLLTFMDVDIPAVGVILVITMIVVGQFFLMNLILAVIIFSFIKVQKKDIQQEISDLLNEDIKLETQEDQNMIGGPLNEIPTMRQALLGGGEGAGAIEIIKDHTDDNTDPKKSGSANKNEQDDDQANFMNLLKPVAQKRKVANMFIENRKEHKIIQEQQEQQEQQQQLNQDEPEDKLLQSTSQPGGLDESIPQDPSAAIEQEEIKVELSETAPIVERKLSLQQKQLSSIMNVMPGTQDNLADQESSVSPPTLSPVGLSESVIQKAQDKKLLVQLPHNKKSNINLEVEQGIQNPILELNPHLKNMEEVRAALEIKDRENLNALLNSVANQSQREPNNEAGGQPSQSNPNDNDGAPQVLTKAKTNMMMRVVRGYIKKKIDQEYDIYFKTLLKEAKEKGKGVSNEKFGQQANIREVVGLKVGLEYIKLQRATNLASQSQDKIQSRNLSNKCYSFAYNLQEKPLFEGFMVFCILVNTAILALDRYPDDKMEIFVLEKINIVYTVIFTLEMLLKIIALGFKNYFRSMFNVFDCLVVASSISDLFLANLIVFSEQDSDSRQVMTAIRAIRLLRIFKLARSWKRFEILIETLGRTLVDIATFSILLFLFIFTFALLGLELFANRAKFDLENDVIDPVNGVSPRYNFDKIFDSCTTVFIVLTNDGMSTIFYYYYRAVGAASSTIFFILLVIIGQKILLNLFIAILLENFDEGVLKEKMHEYEQEQQDKKLVLTGIKKKGWRENLNKRLAKMKRRFEHWLDPDAESEWDEEAEEMTEENKTKIIKNLKLIAGNKNKIKKKLSNILGMVDQSPVLEGTAFNYLPANNRFREIIFKIVMNSYFDYFIIFVIILSAIQLAMDSPLKDPNSQEQLILFWIDVGTTIIFIFEAIFKNIAFGFLFNGKWSYLRQTWNILDFLIIIFSVLSVGPVSEKFKTIKIFRILRSMRLISKNEQLKVAVRALFYAVPNVANITVIMLLFFLIFGVIAVSYFKGKFYYCDSAMENFTLNSKWDCENSGGDWLNRFYNFDDSLSALLVLFVASTSAGWSDLMMICATSTEIDYLPLEDKDASVIWIIFFIIFTIVGAFFFLNLFVGVVISTFHSEHDKIGGNNLLTEKQKEWIDLRLLVLRSEPMRKLKEPQNRIRQYFFKIQNSKLFDKIVLFSIIGNTLILMVKWYEEPAIVDKISEILNYIFTAIFLTEALIKIIAIAPRVYFSDGWNIFDTIIIAGSFVSIFISANTSLEIRGVITILRSFRILRLLRLIKRGHSLRLIFNTFVITLHSLANIGGLLLLFIFMYAILGMILFGNVKRNGIMNDYINFETFNHAYLTLFVVATGDSWNSIMYAYGLENAPSSQCLINPSYEDYIAAGEPVGCGNRPLANAYFISYMFVVNLIFLKIFIAIILQGYNDMQTQDGRLFNIDMNEKFRDTWTEYDPDATTFINMSDFRSFLLALGDPLGFDATHKEKKFLQDQFIASLELPTYHNFSSYQFMDVLDALSFRLMVLDHIQHLQMQQTQTVENKKSLPSNVKIDKDQELDIRVGLQKEVNLLIYQKRNENIMAVREVAEKEHKYLKQKNENRDSNELTSQHHMAAEAAVRKMREYLKKCRRNNNPNLVTEQNYDTVSRASKWRKGGESTSPKNKSPIMNKNTMKSMQRSIPEVHSNEEEDEDDTQSQIGKTRFFSRKTQKARRPTIQKSEQNLRNVIPGLHDHVEQSRNRKQSEGVAGLQFRFRGQHLGVQQPHRKVSRSTNQLDNQLVQVLQKEQTEESKKRSIRGFSIQDLQTRELLKHQRGPSYANPAFQHQEIVRAEQEEEDDDEDLGGGAQLIIGQDGRLIIEEEQDDELLAEDSSTRNNNQSERRLIP